MLSVPFECDFQKVAKINSQQEKTVFSKKSPIRKIKLPQKFGATRYLEN